MAGNRISQVVVMDELDGTVDEFRQVFNIEDCLLFPYDERCDNPVRLVAGDRLHYGPVQTVGQSCLMLRVVILTLEGSRETQTRLAIYGRRQSSGEHRLNSGYFAVRALLIPGDQIQDAWSEIQSAVAAGNVWTVSKSAGYPVLFLTCNDGKVEWRQI